MITLTDIPHNKTQFSDAISGIINVSSKLSTIDKVLYTLPVSIVTYIVILLYAHLFFAKADERFVIKRVLVYYSSVSILLGFFSISFLVIISNDLSLIITRVLAIAVPAFLYLLFSFRWEESLAINNPSKLNKFGRGALFIFEFGILYLVLSLFVFEYDFFYSQTRELELLNEKGESKNIYSFEIVEKTEGIYTIRWQAIVLNKSSDNIYFLKSDTTSLNFDLNKTSIITYINKENSSPRIEFAAQSLQVLSLETKLDSVDFARICDLPFNWIIKCLKANARGLDEFESFYAINLRFYKKETCN